MYTPCPKCGSTNVHFGTPFGYTGGLITRLIRLARQKLTFYVCCACGHVQIAVDSEKDRKRIARDWPTASP